MVASALELNALLPSSAAGLIGGLPAVPPPELLLEMRVTLRTTLEQVMARAGVKGEALILDGSPATELVSSAEELGAELIVVGTHGRTGLIRLALGSVAERVIRSAGCSVLAVRSGRSS